MDYEAVEREGRYNLMHELGPNAPRLFAPQTAVNLAAHLVACDHPGVIPLVWSPEHVCRPRRTLHEGLGGKPITSCALIRFETLAAAADFVRCAHYSSPREARSG